MKDFWVIYKDILRSMTITALWLLYAIGGFILAIALGEWIAQYILNTTKDTILGAGLSCVFIILIESVVVAYIAKKMTL